MQLPALSIMRAMSGTSRLFPMSVRDSHSRCDYAVAYLNETSSGGYLTLAIHRARVSPMGKERR